MKFRGWQLRAARNAADLSIKDLSELAGVTTATLVKWEASEVLETGDSYREAGKIESDKADAVFKVLKQHGVKLAIDGRSITLTK